MAILHCRHCGSAIDSDARRTQCRECRALFPFECAICAQKLRSPFPIFEDERHLTLGEKPQPLCEEHFLRKCPDCAKWFGNNENIGYFRCPDCADKVRDSRMQPEWSDTLVESEAYLEPEAVGRLPSVLSHRAALDFNILALGSAACAFLALVGWFLLGR